MYQHPLNRASAVLPSWLNRYESARSSINPQTGERLRVRTEAERYNGLVENAWVVEY